MDNNHFTDRKAVCNYLANGQVVCNHLADGQVVCNHLTDGKVVCNYLADGQVVCNHLADGQVVCDKLTDGKVVCNQLTDGKVPPENYMSVWQVTCQKLTHFPEGQIHIHWEKQISCISCFIKQDDTRKWACLQIMPKYSLHYEFTDFHGNEFRQYVNVVKASIFSMLHTIKHLQNNSTKTDWFCIFIIPL